jgi:MFS family permease
MSGSSPRLVVPVLASAGVVTSMQATILLPVLSRLPEIYGVGAVAASWLVTVTTMTAALATPVVSRLADQYGKRRLMLIALATTVAGSLLLALSHDFTLALVGRSMQGFGSALMPVALSVLKDLLPAERVPSAVALISSTLGVGAIVGLPVAGLLYTAFGWAALFWMTAIVGALVFAVIWLMLPATGLDGPRSRFDWLGTVLLMLLLVPLLLVITQGNVWGWTSAAVLGAAGLALAAGAAFVGWELRSRSPLVDVRLSVRKPVLLTNAASLAVAMGMFANSLLTSGQLGAPAEAGGFGLSVGLLGLVAAAPAASQVAVSPLVGRLILRYGGRLVFLTGAGWMVVSYLLRLVLDGSVVAVMVGAVLVTLGTGLTLSSLSVLIMDNVPRERTASANGLNTLCRQIGTSTATAALAAVTAVTAATVGGIEYPSTLTRHIAFVGLAATSLVALLIMLWVPRTRAPEAVTTPVPAAVDPAA